MNKKDLISLKHNTMGKEMVRKSIHMTISIIPAIASINKGWTLLLLFIGVSFYLITEIARSNGSPAFGFISSISEIASRERDKGITFGPVTLTLGTIVVLLTFSPVAAACGIYALAFGDGLSSITGKIWGIRKIPFTNGKSFVGFFTCFTMILSTTYGVTRSLRVAFFAAIGGAVIELIPVKDVDNLLIPFIVAIIVSI